MEGLQFVQGADHDQIAIHGEMGPGVRVGDLFFGDQLEPGRIRLDEKEDAFFIQGEQALALGNQAPIFAELLLVQGLVDEVVLLVYPVLLGRGKRFFSDSSDARELSLLSTKAMSSGILMNTYRHVGSLKTE